VGGVWFDDGSRNKRPLTRGGRGVSDSERREGASERVGLRPKKKGKPAPAVALGLRRPAAERARNREGWSCFFSFLEFLKAIQIEFKFLFTCNKNQSITNKICSSMSASTCL